MENNYKKRILAVFRTEQGLADAVNVPRSTVRGWLSKERQRIPIEYHRDVLESRENLTAHITLQLGRDDL